MAAPVIAWAVAGAVGGVVTGLVPGLHANTLALVAAAALAGGAGLPLAAALAAASASHTFVNVVPATFLGAPDPDAAAGSLPAHELLHDGRGSEAVHLSARGSAWGLAVALVLAVPAKLLVDPPVRLLHRLDHALPIVLGGLVLLLLLSERQGLPYRSRLAVEPGGPRTVEGELAHRDDPRLELADGTTLVDPAGWLEDVPVGAHLVTDVRPTRLPGPLSRPLGIAAAAAVLLLSGLVGEVAFAAGARSPLGLPGTLLFPALTGLFGVPALALAARGRDPPRQQLVPATTTWAEEARPGVRGGLFGSLVGLLPGVTSAHATVLALGTAPAPGDEERRREDLLVALSATNTAGAAWALMVLAAAGRARTGVLAVVRDLRPPGPWVGLIPPPDALLLAQALVVGGVVGFAATVRAGDAYGALVRRVPAGRVAGVVLAGLVAATWAFAGALGLVLLAAASLVGWLPWTLGIRRSHAMGVILVPVLRGVVGV